MNPTITRARTSLLIVSIISVVTAFFASTATGQDEIHAFVADAGGAPRGRLVQATDGNFYGTTQFGTVFKMTPAGQMTVLARFSGTNGGSPSGGLVQASDGNFYGTTYTGVSGQDNGTVFKMTPAGQLTTLVAFPLGQLGQDIPADPEGELVQGSDGNFYGTTSFGGDYLLSLGSVYKISPAGVVTPLASFDGQNGSRPRAGLVEASDGNFYGTTERGGTNGNFGTVFRITPAGVLTSLFSFSGTNGSRPRCSLVQGTDGNFYGTTRNGGPFDYGNVFKITPTGTLTVLASFARNINGGNPEAGLVQASDGNFYGTTWADDVFKITPEGVLTRLTDLGDANGGNPLSSLIQGNDGFLYGTTSNEGANGLGTVFKVSTGGALTTLLSFGASSGGATPKAGLVADSDGYFYGTTSEGGSGSSGTVFKTSPSGDFTTIYSFSATYPKAGAFGDTNSDGAAPQAGLIRGGDGSFYGTTSEGGQTGVGTAFKISTNGVMTTLYSFGPLGPVIPQAGLVEGAAGNFYGTTYGGGTNGGFGTVFKMTPAGVVTTLAAFAITNGARPQAALVQGSNGDFYGTTYGGGSNGVSGVGTVFKITTAGTLTMLVSFAGTNGANPAAGLVQGNDGNFYGTTVNGGASGAGTVFKMTPAGNLTTLVSFANTTYGGGPYAGLIQGRDGNFYGTTSYGGLGGGTVFQMTPSGALTLLGRFTATGDNGYAPLAGVVEGIDGSFYGTTSFGFGRNGNIFRVRSAIAPFITLIRQGSNLVFSWPTNAAGFSLVSSTNLIPPVVWNTVVPSPAVVNDRNVVTNPMSGPRKFFRLIHP